jgi:tetratricopeptide (TPR) repeat protein
MAEQASGNLAAARDAFARVLEIDPTFSAGRVATYLANVEYQRGDWAASAAAARQAVELDPAGVEAWLFLGLAQQKLGQILEAQQAFRKAVDLDPERPESQNNLGTVLVALGDHEGAAEAFRKAVELDPDFVAAKANLQQVESALAARQAAASEDPKPRRRTKELGVRFDHTDFSYLGIQGAVVDYVKPRSPAAVGGLEEGDIILGVDGRKIAGPDDFIQYVYRDAPGDAIEVDILRNNRPRRLLIEIR